MSAELFQHTFTEELYSIPRRTMILIPVPWKDLSATEIDLLRKILASVKLPLESVQIIESRNSSLSEYFAQEPTCILSFGTSSGDTDKYYEVQESGNTFYLPADLLNKLDDSSKKKLWVALRQMFKLS